MICEAQREPLSQISPQRLNQQRKRNERRVQFAQQLARESETSPCRSASGLNTTTTPSPPLESLKPMADRGALTTGSNNSAFASTPEATKRGAISQLLGNILAVVLSVFNRYVVRSGGPARLAYKGLFWVLGTAIMIILVIFRPSVAKIKPFAPRAQSRPMLQL